MAPPSLQGCFLLCDCDFQALYPTQELHFFAVLVGVRKLSIFSWLSAPWPKPKSLPQLQSEWPVLSLPCVQGWPGRGQSCALECAGKQCLSPASPLQWKNVKVSSKVWCSLLKRNVLGWEIELNSELNPVLPRVKLCCVVHEDFTLKHFAVHCLILTDPGFLLLGLQRWSSFVLSILSSSLLRQHSPGGDVAHPSWGLYVRSACQLLTSHSRLWLVYIFMVFWRLTCYLSCIFNISLQEKEGFKYHSLCSKG